MADAFAAALTALFRDPNLSVPATYLAAGSEDGVAVRVIRSMPDGEALHAGQRFVVDKVLLDVMVSDAPDLAAGDSFVIGGETFVVQGTPKRDEARITWTAEARAE